MNDIFLKSVSEDRVCGSPLFTRSNFLTKRDEFVDMSVSRSSIGVNVDNTPKNLLDMLVLLDLNNVLIPIPPQNPAPQTKMLWDRLRCNYILSSEGLVRIADHKNLDWPDDLALIMHSSGSTGVPKSIPYGYGRMQKNAGLMMGVLCDDPTKARHIGAMSYCTSGGFYNAILAPLLTGGTVIVSPMATAFGVRQFTDVAVRERANCLWVNPTVLKMLTGIPFAESLPTDAKFISCTAPLLHSDAMQFQIRFKREVLQSYGLAETLFVSVEQPGRHVVTEFACGLILGGNSSVSFGNDGLLTIHNGCVMSGYATVKDKGLIFEMPTGSVPEQSFVTGDLGKLDAAERLVLTGRLCNVVNVGGSKIGMEALERELAKLEFVRDVAVTRIILKDGDERPIVLIVNKSRVNIEAVIEACVTAQGPKARPARIVSVSEIPRTANGKINRNELEKNYRDK